jgi:hypothetical protein
MRAACLRIGLVLVVLLSGCATAAKRQYLRHLSVTIAPERPGVAPAATDTATAMAPRRPAVAAAEGNGPRP